MERPYFGGRAMHLYYHLMTITTYIKDQLVRRAGTLDQMFRETQVVNQD
jgi:hypothetical protein